jgi:hypothetical protein
MKLTGSLLGVGVGLTLAGAQALGQMPPMPPMRPAAYPPGMAVARPDIGPGISAFPPNVAALTPEGSPALQAEPPPDGHPGEGFGPCYGPPTVPIGGGCYVEPPCCPDLLPMPTMIGEFMGFFGTKRDLSVRTFLQDPTGPVTERLVQDIYNVRYPVTARGAVKIAQNESPQPQSRIYYAFNYYTDVRTKFQHAGSLITDLNGDTPGRISVVNGAPVANAFFKEVRIRQDIIGVEVAAPEQVASIGVRCTLTDNMHDVDSLVNEARTIAVNGDDNQTVGSTLRVLNGLDRWEVADLMIIGKVAVARNDCTGDVISAGVAVTIPTGHSVPSDDGRRLHPSLVQPFVGWLYQWGDWYVHGFHSGIIPTDSRDVYMLFNDIGVGYWLYKNDCADDLCINGIAPTIEIHANTPIRNTDYADEPIGAVHSAVVTCGVHVFTFGWASVTTGVGIPVSGPRPYGVDWASAVNIRF